MKIFKRIVLLFVLALLGELNHSVYSQPNFSLGLEAGVNLANINITPTMSTSSRTGLIVGVFADIGLSRTFYIRPGLRYMSKGFSSTSNGITFTDRLSYLEIPALLKVSFPLTEVKPYLVGGPAIGIQLSASEEATDGVQVQTSDASSVFESIDFGLFFGGGVDFRVAGKVDMFVQTGYSLGLSNITKVQTVTGKNYGFQITSGVKFGL